MGNTFWWISFFYRDSLWFFLRSNGGRARTGTEGEDKTRGSGAHRWGFAGRDFCVGLFFFFLMESFRRGNQEERKGRQRNFSIVFLWFFSSGLVLSWNGNRRKALKGGWRGLVFGIIRVVFFHRKTDFFRNSRPSFRVELWLFYLEQIRVFKAG